MMAQKSYKVRNMIWLTLEDEVALRKAWEPVSSFMATNQYITRIVQLYLSKPELQEELLKGLSTEMPRALARKQVKEVEDRTVYVIQCPFCGEKYPGLNALQAHLVKVHGAVKELPEGEKEVVKDES